MTLPQLSSPPSHEEVLLHRIAYFLALMVPPSRVTNITPSDTESLPENTRQLIADADGDVRVLMREDTAPMVIALKAGMPWIGQVRQVFATGTTATGIKAYW